MRHSLWLSSAWRSTVTAQGLPESTIESARRPVPVTPGRRATLAITLLFGWANVLGAIFFAWNFQSFDDVLDVDLLLNLALLGDCCGVTGSSLFG
jgi:hypothetical protein